MKSIDASDSNAFEPVEAVLLTLTKIKTIRFRKRVSPAKSSHIIDPTIIIKVTANMHNAAELGVAYARTMIAAVVGAAFHKTARTPVSCQVEDTIPAKRKRPGRMNRLLGKRQFRPFMSTVDAAAAFLRSQRISFTWTNSNA